MSARGQYNKPGSSASAASIVAALGLAFVATAVGGRGGKR